MRNLVEYPVNTDEAISAIQIAAERYTREVKEYGIGDIDGVALMMVEKFIEENRENFDSFSKKELYKIFR